MSEKEKKDIPAEEVNTEPAAEEVKEEIKEETFTVTREQMEKMEQLAQMVAESGDKYLRLAAEYDNYRKRTVKEKESLYNSAKADTIKPFLDVYDNLLRGAAQFAEDDPNRQGMEMICKQFIDVLAKLGVTEIEAQGKPFDPERHNAVMHVEDEEIEESTVVEVFQKGFIMGEKVLRFSMVKVAN
ncbi:MAG: nucleotide exchange factor GrpE [Ruminococcaceae bacterium]|nr:nucleotide exchange factor GrpE [Oscillospiraceae bacterium]